MHTLLRRSLTIIFSRYWANATDNSRDTGRSTELSPKVHSVRCAPLSTLLSLFFSSFLSEQQVVNGGSAEWQVGRSDLEWLGEIVYSYQLLSA